MKWNKRRKSEQLSLLFILQGMFAILYINMVIKYDSLINIHYSLLLFDIIYIAITLRISGDLKRADSYYKEEAEKKVINSHVESIEELIGIVNNQKTNHHMHMQTISTLLYLNKYDELSNYIKDVANDYTQDIIFRDVGHNVVTSIVNAKKVIAKENGVRFYIRGKISNKDFDINPNELSTVLSNVLNNAIEACKYYGENSWTNIIINDDSSNLYFKIVNRGHVKDEIIDDIYEMGTSTKQSIGKGYGLYIVKQIIDKYSGNIEIANNENNTVAVEITIPRRQECSIVDIKNSAIV